MMRWLKDKKRERRPNGQEEGGKEEKEDDYGFEKEKPASKSPSSRRQLPPPPVAPEEKSPHIYEEIPDIAPTERAEYERTLLHKLSRHKKYQNGGKDGSQGDKGKNSSSSSTAASKDEISPYMVVPVDKDVRQTPTNFHRNGTPEVHCDVIVKDTHCEILLTRKPKVGAFRLDSTAAGGERNSSATRNNTHFCSRDRRASMEVRSGPGKATSAFNIATSSSAFSASSSSSSKANSMSMSNLSERQYPMQKVSEERDEAEEAQGVETYTTASNFIPRATNLTFHPLKVGSTNSLGSGTCGLVYGKTSVGTVNNLSNNSNNNNSSSNNEEASMCVTYTSVRDQSNTSNGVSYASILDQNAQGSCVSYASILDQNAQGSCVSYASILDQNAQGSCVSYDSIQEEKLTSAASKQSFFYQSQGDVPLAYQGNRDHKPSQLNVGNLSLNSNSNFNFNLNSNLNSGGGAKTGVIRPCSPSASSSCTYASVSFPCETKHYNTIPELILPEVARRPDMDHGLVPDDPKDDPNVIYSSIDVTFGLETEGRAGEFYDVQEEIRHDVMYSGLAPYSRTGAVCPDISYSHCCQDNNNNNSSSCCNNGNNNCMNTMNSIRGDTNTVPYNSNNNNSSSKKDNVEMSGNLLMSSRFCGKNLALEFCTCSDDQHSSSCDCPDVKPFDDAASLQAESAAAPSSCDGCGRLIRQITYSESLSDETYEHVYASRLLLRSGRRYSSPDITVSDISNTEVHDIPNSRSPEFMNAISRDDTWMARRDNVISSLPSSGSGRNNDVAVADAAAVDRVPGGVKAPSSHNEAGTSTPQRRGRSTQRRTHSALLRKKEHTRVDRSLDTRKTRRSSEHFPVPSTKTPFVLPMKGASSCGQTQRKSAVELLEPKTNAFSGLFSRFSRSRSKQRKTENNEQEVTPGTGNKLLASEAIGTSGDRDLEEIPDKNTKKLSKFFQKLSYKDGVRDTGDAPADFSLDPVSKSDSFYHACAVAVDSEPQAKAFLPALASQHSGATGDLPQDFPDARGSYASKRDSSQLRPSATPFEKETSQATLDAAAPTQTEPLAEASGAACKPASKTDSGDTCYEYDVSTSSEGEQPSHDCILSKFKVADFNMENGDELGYRRKKVVCKRCRPAIYSGVQGMEGEDVLGECCPHLSVKCEDLSAILGELVVDQRAAILNCLTDYTHNPYSLKGQGHGHCRECGCEIVTSDSESMTTVYSVLSQQYHVTSPGAHTPSCDSDEGTMADNSGESADENENDSSGYDEPGLSMVEHHHHPHHHQQQQQQQQQRLSSHKVKKKERSKEKKEKRGSSGHAHNMAKDHEKRGSSGHAHNMAKDHEKRGSSGHAHNMAKDHEKRGSPGHAHNMAKDHEKRGSSGHAHNMAKDHEKLRKKLAVEIICAEIGEAGKSRRRHGVTSDSISNKLSVDAASRDSSHCRGSKTAQKKGLAGVGGAGGGGGGGSWHQPTSLRLKEDSGPYSKGDHSKFCEITKTKSSVARDRAIEDIYAPLPPKALSLLTCRQRGPQGRLTCTCGHGGMAATKVTVQGEDFRNKDGAAVTAWEVENEAIIAMDRSGVNRVHSRDTVGPAECREGLSRSEDISKQGGSKGGKEPEEEGQNRPEVNGCGGQRGEEEKRRQGVLGAEEGVYCDTKREEEKEEEEEEEDKSRSRENVTKTTEISTAEKNLTNSGSGTIRQKQQLQHHHQQQQQQQQPQESRSEVNTDTHKISLRRLQRIQPSTFDLLPETALGGDLETCVTTLHLKPAKTKMVETLARMYESNMAGLPPGETVLESQGKGKHTSSSKDTNKDTSKDTSLSQSTEHSNRTKPAVTEGLVQGRELPQDSSECRNKNSVKTSAMMEGSGCGGVENPERTHETSRSRGRKESSQASAVGGGGGGTVIAAAWSLNTVDDHPQDSPALIHTATSDSLCEPSRGAHLNGKTSAESHGPTETVSAISDANEEKVGIDASDSYECRGKSADVSDSKSNIVKIMKQKSPSPSSSSSSSKRKGVKHKRLSKKSYHRKRSKSRCGGECRREEKTYYYFSSDMSDLDVVEVEDWQTYSSSAQSRPVSRSESKTSETDDAMAGVTLEKAGRGIYSRAGTDDDAMQEVYAIPPGSAELRGGRSATDSGNATQRSAEAAKPVKTKRTDVYKTRRGNNRLLSDLIFLNYDRQCFGGSV